MTNAPRRRSTVLVLLAALGVLYVLVLLLGDARAYSGSDAGGKAATARIMAERSTTDPDIGYWAATADPTGIDHPIVNTERRGDAWVQTTSIPFSIAEARLWAWGGARAALLLPMAGALLAAYGAWLLALVLGGTTRVAAVALGVVGAAGPVGFYATDLWEHAPAVGLALVGTALVLDRPRARSALVAGLALSTAVVLRAEVAVHVAVLGVAVLATAPLRRTILRPMVAVAGFVGLVVPVIANRMIEAATLGNDLRAGRAGSLASGAGHGLGRRLQDAILVSGSPFADERRPAVVLAAFVVALAATIAVIGLGERAVHPRVVRVLGTLAVAVYVSRFAQGPGFIPGMIAAAPLAAPGAVTSLARGIDPVRRVVGLVALAQLPAIWMLQWSGNHVAQWGGRYVLLPGALLTVVGAVALFEHTTYASYRKAMLVLSAAVGIFGLVWHVQRTNQVAAAFTTIDALPPTTVVISTDGNALREGGAFFAYGTRWLRADDASTVFAFDGFADRLALDDVTLLTPLDDALAAPPSGFALIDARTLDMPGPDLALRRYVRSAP